MPMNRKSTPNSFSDKLPALVLTENASGGVSHVEPAPGVASAPPAVIAAAPASPPAAPVQRPKSPQCPQFSAAAADNLDAITDSRIESLARRQRADSFLRSLTQEQARRLYRWIFEFKDIGEVHSRVTALPPEGLGLDVSTITLRRLRSYWQAAAEASFSRDMLDFITDMELESPLAQPARIQNAICHLLQGKAFDLARTVPGSPVMKDLLSGIEKLSNLDLKRQKILLERERLLRARTADPAPTQHHRVDLNFVPPKRDPAIVLSGNPPATPQQLPPPDNSTA